MENGCRTFLFVLSAPSGAGKTTLCKKLLADFPSMRLSISSTTRKPRGTEQEGVDYYFVSQEEFQNKIQKNRFAEWALVHGNYYGTSKEVIERTMQDGFSVLLDIDVQGAEQLKLAYPNDCFRIFIAPPTLSELESRLRKRGTDSDDVIQKRLKNAEMEMKEGQKFDRVIVNDSLERAYSDLKGIVEKMMAHSVQGVMNG
jgi:guanylate kinase